MNKIKNLASPVSRNYRPWLACRNIIEEGNSIWSKTSILKLDTRDGWAVSLYPEFLLAGGHCSIIYSLMDGINGGGLGECISYRVVLAQDMASMVSLKSASATGLSLPRMWNLWRPWRVYQFWGCPCSGYGIYGGPGECISYAVVLTSWRVHQLRGCPWLGYGIYGGPGECISYGIILALDMACMVALENASATVLSLPWMWWISIVNSDMLLSSWPLLRNLSHGERGLWTV